MRRLRHALALAAAVLIALTVAIVIPTAAQAAPPFDPANGNWSRWTFHSGGNYDLVIDASRSGGNGSAVQLYGDHLGSNQVWFQEAASGGGQYLHPGYDRWLCLGRTGNGWGDRAEIQNCNGTVSQLWNLPRYSQQQYFITPFDDSNICLDVPSSNFSQGVDLQLWGCNYSNAQAWSTARCYAGGCDREWPDISDCDTAGARQVDDVSQAGDRVVLFYSAGCQAYWATASRSSAWASSSVLTLRRHGPDGTLELRLTVNRGESRWSSLLGKRQAEDSFEACSGSSQYPSDGIFCTSRHS
ncbi:RICIN domain-containing protein [Micromonospora sp. DT228]|uniref:RICIN domain-containing protein n=1 Tax=Micromonospora sp. DT228 TaxID=3393443 RepID=UPI003CF5BC0A